MGEIEFLEKVAAILELDADVATRETRLEEGTMDSLEILSMIAALDEEFGITVPTASLKACRTVGDIIALTTAPDA